MADSRMEKHDSTSSPASSQKDTLQHDEVVQKPTSAIEKAQILEARHEIDPTLDRRVTRKCDFHIIPWLFGIWLLAFIDRSVLLLLLTAQYSPSADRISAMPKSTALLMT